MHASIAFKSALALIALARAVAGACDNSGQPVALCCTSFGPASDFAYVLENVCGVTVPDQSLDTGAGCESGVPWYVPMSMCGCIALTERARPQRRQRVPGRLQRLLRRDHQCVDPAVASCHV